MVSSITIVNDGCPGHTGWCRTGPKQTSQEDKGSYVSVKAKSQSLKATEYGNNVSETSAIGETLVSQTDEYRLQIVMCISSITVLISKLRILHKMSQYLRQHPISQLSGGQNRAQGGHEWQSEGDDFPLQPSITPYLSEKDKLLLAVGLTHGCADRHGPSGSPHFHLLGQPPLKLLAHLACPLGNQQPWYSFILYAGTSELSRCTDAFCLD